MTEEPIIVRQHFTPRIQHGNDDRQAGISSPLKVSTKVWTKLVRVVQAPPNKGLGTTSSTGTTLGARRSNQQRFCSRDPNFVYIVDPYSRKLEVPRECMLETLKGIGIASLCMLFLQGRCRAGNKCHQAHVDPEVIEHLRREALASPTCCCKHGDSHSAQVAALIGDRKVYMYDQEVPAALFAGTLGLQRLLREGGREGDPRIDLPPRLLCRLHLANKCRYVEECNHIHVCRAAFPNVLGRRPVELNTFSLSSINSNGDTTSTEGSSTTYEGPGTPLAMAAPGNRWKHSPYQWRVLQHYDYMTEDETDTLSYIPPLFEVFLPAPPPLPFLAAGRFNITNGH